MPAPDVKRRHISFLSLCVILLPCFSYAIIGDAPLIPFLSGFFLTISFLIKRPIETTKRAAIYSLTISILISVILNETYPVDGDRFFIPLPTEILFPFVISCAICATFFNQSPFSLTIILVLSAFSMMLHGSCVSNPTNTRFIIESDLWNNRYWIFGFFLFLQMTAFLPLLYFAQEKRFRFGSSQQNVKKKIAVYLTSFLLLAGCIVTSCVFAEKLETMMEPFFNSVFRSYFYAYRSKIVFGNQVDLYRKVAPNVQGYQNRIVLRAKSNSAPGYLRGRVYTSYQNGKWSNPDGKTFTNLTLLHNANKSLNVNHFSRDENDKNYNLQNQIDIIPSKYFYSDVLLASGNTDSLEIIAESIDSNRDGVLMPKDWDKQGAYTFYRNNVRSDSAFNNEKAIIPNLGYNQIFQNPALKFELNKIATALLQDAGMTTLRKIQIIEFFFNTSFEYSLDEKPDNKADPVLHFLKTSKSGHCELFATAAALLLRTQGIPTRYVTGFVCSEPHPNRDYWLARLGDCHAWLEAWLPDEKRWVLVEPTPPSGIPAGVEKTRFFNRYIEHLVVFWKEGFAKIKRGYFASAVITYLTSIRKFISWIFWTGPWQIGWGIVGIGLFFSYNFILKRRKSNIYYNHSLKEYHTFLRRIEKYLKRFNIKRTDSMTVREIIKLIESKKIPKAAEIIEILANYESIRYRPAPPDKKQMLALSQKFREIVV